MTAEQLSAEVYSKLVELDYARKVDSFSEAGYQQFSQLDSDVQKAIHSLPVLFIDERESLLDIDSLDGKQQFYLFQNALGFFLVDTQGYNYPRYILRLWGFELKEESDDSFERMDGLVRIADVAILKSVVKSLAFDLQEEGFDRADIINFIDAQIYGALLEK